MVRLIPRAAAVAAVLCALATPAWAGYKEGAAAYKQGNYKTALRELWPLAEQGHMNAQLLLASCYMFGKGTARNPVEAEKWMRKAAEQGSPLGQLSLGGMLYQGLGVKVDYPQALRCVSGRHHADRGSRRPARLSPAGADRTCWTISGSRSMTIRKARAA